MFNQIFFRKRKNHDYPRRWKIFRKRTISFKGDTAGRNYQEGEQCAFYCGPESETEGMLNDYEAFEGSGLNIDIGASESYHLIWYDSTKSFEEVWEIVKNRLIPLGFIEID